MSERDTLTEPVSRANLKLCCAVLLKRALLRRQSQTEPAALVGEESCCGEATERETTGEERSEREREAAHFTSLHFTTEASKLLVKAVPVSACACA